MASKAEEIELSTGKPKRKGAAGKLDSIKSWVWDSEKKAFLDRTAASWAKIGLFYLVYYGCLAGFFAIMLVVFFQTMTDEKPSLTEYQSLIKFNPGMGYRPQPDVERTLIEFKQGQPETYQHYIDNLQSFLEDYEDQTGTDPCADGDTERDPAVPCSFPVSQLSGDCTYDRKFGYDEGRPCVLLKMNKIYNWLPEDFDNGTVPVEAGSNYSPGNVAITCEGEEAPDVDNMGPMKFYPSAGINFKYYPYLNQEGFLTPFVMVQFTEPRPGTLVQVWCKAWAKNIYHDKNDRAGSVHFEIFVD